MNELNKGLIFRTIYINKNLYEKLRDTALKNNLSQSDLIRFCIDKGLSLNHTPIKINKAISLILRSVDISTHSEDMLKTMSFDLKIEKNASKLIKYPLNNKIKTLSKNVILDNDIYSDLISYMKTNKIIEPEEVFINSILKLDLTELIKIKKEKELPSSLIKSKIK